MLGSLSLQTQQCSLFLAVFLLFHFLLFFGYKRRLKRICYLCYSLTAKLITISFYLSSWVPDAGVAQIAVQDDNMPLGHVVPKGILLTCDMVKSLAEEKSQHREGETKLGYGSAKANGLNTSKRQELKWPTHTHVAAHQPTLSLVFQPLQIVWSVGDHAEVISSPLCQSPTYPKYCKVEDATYIYVQVFHMLRSKCKFLFSSTSWIKWYFMTDFSILCWSVEVLHTLLAASWFAWLRPMEPTAANSSQEDQTFNWLA